MHTVSRNTCRCSQHFMASRDPDDALFLQCKTRARSEPYVTGVGYNMDPSTIHSLYATTRLLEPKIFFDFCASIRKQLEPTRQFTIFLLPPGYNQSPRYVSISELVSGNIQSPRYFYRFCANVRLQLFTIPVLVSSYNSSPQYYYNFWELSLNNSS